MLLNDNKKYIFLDGAMGTMLQKAGLKLGERPEVFNITEPDIIQDIHRKYIDAGSNIVYANTFGANELKLNGTGYTVEEIIKAAVNNAKIAVKGTNALVALDIGPLGELLEPNGTLTFEKAYDCFSRMVKAGVHEKVDLLVFETMTDLYEVKAGILAAKENSNLPVFVSMTFEENMRTFTGCLVDSFAALATALDVDAIGINCSLGPDEILPICGRLSSLTPLPVFVKPNAGMPDPKTGEYKITPCDFAKSLKKYQGIGVSIVGGCCGTTPEYIKEVVKEFEGKTPIKRNFINKSICSTDTRVVNIDNVKVIGERINPTGKKLMRQALLDGDMGYILKQAVTQMDAGADILDVNVGAPGVNEIEVLPRVVKQIQSVSDLPLQIDSSNPEAIEKALRVYNGRPIVNSVNGNDEILDKILPICKKYGAGVVGLTLDKDGIPERACDRLKIAKKILDRAISYGINKEDVYIDCLTLTVSAQQEAAAETLKALSMVKKELGLKTVLGVSNISFGLPNRELLNHSFLLMALHSGLDLPIMNPNTLSMMDAVRAYRVLENIDKQSIDYIEAYKDYKVSNIIVEKKTVIEEESSSPLVNAVKKGLENDSREITKELLKTIDPMDIVNKLLIPALDEVGMLFEKGKLFLPQLLQAASSAQVAFDEIKKVLTDQEIDNKKGPIIMATVKGDIHDIGKNIVKVILENYGYYVIDLGKDVSPELIVEKAKQTNAKLIGLSALMTTTLKSMEKTISLLHEEKVNAKIMVGGSVLTPDYAIKIGADFYSKDAKQAVDIAKQVIL